MKKVAWVGLLLLTGMLIFRFSMATSTASPDAADSALKQVTENIYAMVGDMAVPNKANQGFICNSAFVITETSVVVVDPGGSLQVGKKLIREIRKLTDKPISHVINTHHHADHWMGNHAFSLLSPRPVIIGHGLMRDSAKEIGERWLKIIADMTGGANAGTKVVLPDKIVNGDEKFTIGGMTFQLFHPKHAHTKGDIAVYIPEASTLISGDILFYLRTPGFQDASPLGNLAALKKMKAYQARHVIPGHGPVTDQAGLDYMIEYIQILHKEVHRLFEDGEEAYDMKDKINIGDYRNMSGFNERFGINVNRMYYEVEAQSFK